MDFPRKTEHEEQVSVIIWAEIAAYKCAELDLLYAIPNGGKRHIATAMKLKAEGVKPGVPDLFLPVARNGYHGLYIEMKPKLRGIKKPVKPGPSKKQDWWLKKLTEQGYSCHCCRGADAAISVVKEYLGMEKGVNAVKSHT